MKIKIEFGDDFVAIHEPDYIIEKMLKRMTELIDEYVLGRDSEEWMMLADTVATYLNYFYNKNYDEQVAVYDYETGEPYFEF